MHKKITFVCFIVVALTITNVALAGTKRTEKIVTESSPFEILWEKTYGGSKNDQVLAMLQTDAGDVILAGSAKSYSPDDNAVMWLVQTDTNGEMEWNRTLGHTQARSIDQTMDGGFILGGWTGIGSSSADNLLVKTDSTGQHIWNQTYGGSGWDWTDSAIQTSDGGYAFSSDQDSFGAGNHDWWLVKTNPSGVMEWNTTFGGNNWDWPHSLLQTADSGFLIAGNTESFGAGSQDFWVVKTDDSGLMEWNQTYGGFAYEQGLEIIPTSDGGYALAGRTKSYGVGLEDMWLVKIDSTGQPEWNQTYGGSGDDWINSLIQTADDGYVLAGGTRPTGKGDDLFLVKTDSTGNFEADFTYGGSSNDKISSLVQTTAGDFILSGSTESKGAGGLDLWLLKVGYDESKLTSKPASSPGFELIAVVGVLAIVARYRKLRKKF